MQRPERLSDQYHGKAGAELMRGSGWWPLQPHPCRLEPPWNPYHQHSVTPWDCFINGWEAPWEGSPWRRMFSGEEPILPYGKPIVLPEEACHTWDDLVAITVAQFPEDEVTIPKADQLLRTLSKLHRPVAFEICGMGARPQFDMTKAGGLVASGKSISEAIKGWSEPFIVVQFVAHRSDAALLQRQLLAHYPNSAVTVDTDLETDPGFAISNGRGYGATLALSQGYGFPLRTISRLEPDPLGVALAAMDHLGKDDWALLQILLAPARCPWADTLMKAMTNPYKPDEFIFADLDRKILQEKFASPLFAVSMRVAAGTAGVFRQLLGWAEQFTRPPQQLVVNDTAWEGRQFSEEERHTVGWSLTARCTHRPGILLNVEELAGLVHLPGKSVVSNRLRAVKSRTRPAPVVAPEPGSVLLGENIHQGRQRLARIEAKLRARHCYIAGASGTGKSTLLLNLIMQDIANGHGVGLLDPHGDLVKAVLRRIPPARQDDVILFDPADVEFPFALNILDAADDSEQERIVAETVMALERYFPASWGPRLERILTYTIHTVLHALPGATLADVERMLTDEEFRDEVVAKTTDARYLSFWQKQFSCFPKNAVDPVLNKLSVFLLNRTVRNIICQRHAAIDFDQVLNRGKILLANLSTGLLTEKIAGTFGSFLVTKIVNAAFRRARLPEHQRRPWYLYIDEFQAFMNLSVGFERILAEARKYKLILAGLANQYVGQLSVPVRQAVFGNVGTFVVFRLGVDDATIVAKELGVFTAEEILNLNVGEAIARAGSSATAFNIRSYTEPPVPKDDGSQNIVVLNRKHYCRPRQEVEADVGEGCVEDPALISGSPNEHPQDDPVEDDLVM